MLVVENEGRTEGGIQPYRTFAHDLGNVEFLAVKMPLQFGSQWHQNRF